MVNNNIITKTATMTISSSSIPEEIIVYEILKRLPVKTLCRFKAVSKRWLSIIYSRPFIDSHFQHSKSNPTRLFGFHNKDTTTQHPPIFFSPNYPLTSSYNWPDTYYSWCSSKSPRGLICFYGTDGDDTVGVQIWNPSTGEHIEVNPKPPRKPRKQSLFLGFDPVSKKHKLLLTSSDGENYVFTLGENKWRKIHNSSNNLTLQVQKDGQCIDGILYYLARRDQTDDELVLVRFDVGSEIFLEPIQLPGDLVRFPRDYNNFSSGIYVYRGKILLLNYDNIRTYCRFQMWVLEKHNKWSSKRLIPWEPPSPEIDYSVGFIDGEELLLYSSQLDATNSECNFRLCSYDLEKGSGWTETRFPELQKKLEGSARYGVGFCYYVNTLEPLKPLRIEQEQ